MRLDRLIANSGIGTRSAVRSIISHGSVQVNGAVVTDASFHVKETDSITIDGQEINLQTKLYFLLDKPDGVLTASVFPALRITFLQNLSLRSSRLSEDLISIHRDFSS